MVSWYQLGCGEVVSATKTFTFDDTSHHQCTQNSITNALPSPRQLNLSKIASMLPKFEEDYNSDGEAGMRCDNLETKG
eukprot:11628393-Ditylum_brightwellii.AAC.1